MFSLSLSLSCLSLRGFSSHLDQIGPQIQNKVLNMGDRPVSPQSLSVQMEAAGFSRDELHSKSKEPMSDLRV